MNIRTSSLTALLAVAIALSAQGCASKPLTENNSSQGNVVVNKQSAIDSSRVARIKVDREGRIFLNEKQVSLDELKDAFARLKQDNGVVWYYRENPEGEPTAEATSVIQAIISAKLPVKLSSKPDYSDTVGPEGKSNPTP
jgi:hypothetical protein